ncbi:MAG: AMIN domain-containing protein [Sulfurospirillum sp.]|nr:AMIN domain-containing protein [Sulfurospirillum sp.]
MQKLLFSCLLLFTYAQARENPFVALQSAKNMSEATKKLKPKEFFDTQIIKFPSSARVLKGLSLEYQNLDGSLETQRIEIDKEIDWHDTFVLQKKFTVQETQVTPQPQSKLQQAKKSIDFFQTLHVEISEKNIYLQTRDKKLRDFLIASPYKIVLDFAKELSFLTTEYPLDITPFTSLVIGKHDGYYRVVFELDGQYIYTIQKIQDGYLIKLK